VILVVAVRLFEPQCSYISAVDWVILTILVFSFWRKWRHPVRYGSKIAPQRLPFWKSIRRHISAVSDPILVKSGMLTQNGTSITAMRSKSKLRKTTDWKRKICHWSCRYVSAGCYSNVRAGFLAGVAQLHNLLNSGTGIHSTVRRDNRTIFGRPLGLGLCHRKSVRPSVTLVYCGQTA